MFSQPISQCCGSGDGSGSARIHIIFPDPVSIPGCLGSRSVSYSNEYNKINWKGKFNKVCLLVGSFTPTDKENQQKDCFRFITFFFFFNSKDPDRDQTVGSASVSN